MREQFELDDQAGLALEVAMHAALANGDGHCGTEYLLYGLVTTASGELSELTHLFALDPLRVDRAIDRLIEQRKADGLFSAGRPLLSLRAREALSTPRLDLRAPTGVFEIMHGLLADDDSGACRVLRALGVQPQEARRLTSYGIRHMTKHEVDALIADLDRRTPAHRPWWGPDAGVRLRPILGSNRSGEHSPRHVVASSDSTEVELRAVGGDSAGCGFTLAVRSLRDWVLPPLFEPTESLVPGHGASFHDGPEFFLLQLTSVDGSTIDNRAVSERFTPDRPESSRLVQLGRRDERRALNDRRQSDFTIITTDWWAWPLPTPGPMELRVDWPAESVSGSIVFDAGRLRATG